MALARQLVANRRDLFDPAAARARYRWLLERDQNCIVSPDADGLLCGLFMSHHLGWRVRGFYDGKALVCDHRVRARECVFLDMEIYRAGVRSAGQHMLLYNKSHVPENWSNFYGCFSINNFRGYDVNSEFALKYPFGTIHFLLAAVHEAIAITLPDSAVAPVLFVDGTYHNLFRYTENCRDWLRYLAIADHANPLHKLFMRHEHSIYGLMSLMEQFWSERDTISIPGQRGDRIAITRRGGNGEVFNVVQERDGYSRLDDGAKQRGEAFLKLLSAKTLWAYEPGKWSWRHWRVCEFQKGVIRPTIQRFRELMAQNPLSFAVTGSRSGSGREMEYTLDPGGLFSTL